MKIKIFLSILQFKKDSRFKLSLNTNDLSLKDLVMQPSLYINITWSKFDLFRDKRECCFYNVVVQSRILSIICTSLTVCTEHWCLDIWLQALFLNSSVTCSTENEVIRVLVCWLWIHTYLEKISNIRDSSMSLIRQGAR